MKSTITAILILANIVLVQAYPATLSMQVRRPAHRPHVLQSFRGPCKFHGPCKKKDFWAQSPYFHPVFRHGSLHIMHTHLLHFFSVLKVTHIWGNGRHKADFYVACNYAHQIEYFSQMKNHVGIPQHTQSYIQKIWEEWMNWCCGAWRSS
jgi:hypothetical protein